MRRAPLAALGFAFAAAAFAPGAPLGAQTTAAAAASARA